MNILILFSQPWRVGGAETHVEALIKGLEQEKVFLIVNVGSDEKKIDKLKDHHKNLQVIKMQFRGINIFSWINDFIKLKNIVCKNKIDIIFAQQRTAGIWTYLLNNFIKVKFTVTMHDPWHRAIAKKIYSKLFSKVLVVSENLKEILKNEFSFNEQQILKIDNGIDFSKFQPINKKIICEKLQLPNDVKILLHVSRLSNVKGAVALVIIDSMEKVMDYNKNFKLIIIGEGPLKNEIEQKSIKFNEKYGDVISVIDFQDNITDWYNCADSIIAEGRVAIEALACLKPVVAIRNNNKFIGYITKEKIPYACDVNFDGLDQVVSSDSLAQEIIVSLTQTNEEAEAIKHYIIKRLNFNEMANRYLSVLK